jgi:hypothetical protein
MGYLDNLDNGPLNKYKRDFKNRKKFIDVLFYLWIEGHSNFIKFYYRLIVHQRLLNWNRCKLYKNLMVFDGQSNEIIWNLNDPQSISRRTNP